jgi:2-hydroxychromene-2-carboxylate isomerase
VRVHDGPLTDAAFYFDLASADCYLVAERVTQVLPALDWQPARISAPAAQDDPGRSREALEHRARALGLQPLRWPAEYPFDGEKAMLAATYAKEIGRGVAFAQAAFRQAFAGAHSLAGDDYVLIAAAACEIHPAAVLRAIARRRVRERLDAASEAAAAAGVTSLPAIRVAGHVFCGAQSLDAATAHVALQALDHERGETRDRFTARCAEVTSR